MRLIAAVTLAVGLASCTSVGTEVDQSKVTAFERGKTTYAEVIRTLGDPSASTLTDNGFRTAIYTHLQGSSRAQTYTFAFDQADILMTVTDTTGQSTGSYGLAN